MGGSYTSAQTTKLNALAKSFGMGENAGLELFAPRGSYRALVQALVVLVAVHGAAPGVAAAENETTGAANPDTAWVHAGQADPAAGLSFETSAHRAWYSVFWSGKCGELPFFERLVCLNGHPTWTDITQMVLANAQPDARAAMRDKIIRLGRMIGHEWARHNDERRIDNDDLNRWSEWLKNEPDVAGAVERISEAARRRLSDDRNRSAPPAERPLVFRN